MMKNHLKTKMKSLFAFMVLIASLGAAAQNKQYQIELIVASHVTKQSLMEEEWPSMAVRPLPYYEAFPLPELSDHASYFDYKPVPKSEWQLGHAYKAFQRLKNHKMVFHNTWQQPLSEQSRNPYLFIFSDNIFSSAASETTDDAILPPREFEGRVRLSRSRHLHLELDLALRVPAYVIERVQPKTRFQEDETSGEEQASTFSWFKRTFKPKRTPAFYLFRLESSRKVRLGEVHLFDHPLYSVLVKVTKAPEQPTPAATAELAID